MNEEPPLGRRESRGISSLKRKMLQLVRIERAFDRPRAPAKEEIRMDALPVYSDSKQIESALLEVERKKAEALMHWQRHRFMRPVKKTNQ